MAVSVFDLFKVGIGPSSSHTVGPMVAAARFASELAGLQEAGRVTGLLVELFGSLGATGHGHGSEAAVLMGLLGESPDTVDTSTIAARCDQIRQQLRISLDEVHRGDELTVDFDPASDLVLHRTKRLPGHPNGMVFTAMSGGDVLQQRTFYSIGGGFVLEDGGDGDPRVVPDDTSVPYPFRTGDDLLRQCSEHRMTVPEVMVANECARRADQDVRTGLLHIWDVMRECVAAGCATSGVLPGGLKVRRRAARMMRDLTAVQSRSGATADPLAGTDWLTVWALAVNEQNAAGGRVVTAPTNGAAGIIPAVLHYVHRFVDDSDDAVVTFLLTAGAIGAIFQQTASISGAEVGCQGEVGTACAMAAAAFAQVLGGTPHQVCNAAEIGLEHHLGLTCDPVGGLVQIPCIERNAIGAIKAVSAARLAMHGDGVQHVSLDQVTRTMVQTGRDMSVKYKETARGGLAVNIVEC